MVAKTEQLQPPSSCRVALSIVVALFETLLFSGVSYGVVSLVPMLESRGVYAYLCINSSSVAADNLTARCTAVQTQVTLAFTITQVVTPFGNLLSGFILDRLGFRAVKAVAAAMFGLGCLCFTLVQPGVDWLIFPGTVMLGFSGIQVIMSNIQLAPMVKFPFVVASLISGLFDACTMVASTLWIISKSGVSSYITFGVYTVLGVATIALSIVVYPGKHSVLQVELESSDTSGGVKQQKKVAVESEPEPSRESGANMTLAQELLTTDFILMLVWFICSYLRLNYFFGSLSAYVDVITGDKAQVEYYSTIFGYFFLASPLISLLPGALLDLQKRFIPTLRQNSRRAYKLNTVSSLSLTALIGAASCLLLLANSTGMLIPVYIVIALHRAFLFATLGNYCISVFSPHHFGIVYTLMFCTAAPFVFLTVPLTNWLVDANNPNPNNYILAALACVSLVHPAVLLLRNLPGTGQKQVQPLSGESDWKTRIDGRQMTDYSS